MLKTVVGVLNGMGLPLSRSRRGLGSNVSIWEGPPSMKRKMTDFARAPPAENGRAVFSESIAASASPPNPFAARRSISRRLAYIDKLRRIQQHVRDTLPGAMLQVAQDLLHLRGIGLASEGRLIQKADAAGGVRRGVDGAARPTFCLRCDELIIHHQQRLRRHGGRRSHAKGGDGQRVIEREEKRRQKIPAQLDIDAA